MANLEERFLGCLLGAAVGDAIGFCLVSRTFDFNYDPSQMDRRDVASFRYFSAFGCPPGQVTDVTQMSLAVARMIIREQGVSPDTLASELMSIWQGEGSGPPEEVTSLIKGALREDDGGPVQGAGNEAAVRSPPVGLWNWKRKAAIPSDCRAQSEVTHSDPRAGSGAAVIARAVALNVRGEPLDTLSYLDAIAPSPDEAGGGELRSYLPQVPEWLRMKEDLSVAEIARAGQDVYFGSTISRYVTPSVLLSLYAFLRAPDDFCESLAIAFRAGGDVNSTGAMTGALAGARVGMADIPELLPGGLQAADEVRDIALDLLRVTEAREASP